MKQNRKALLLLFSLCAIIALLSKCVSGVTTDADPRGPAFAGSATCKKCHETIYNAYTASAHFITTQPASDQNTLGSFAERKNRFTYNDSSYVLLQKRDSGLFQASYINDKEIASHRMDILFGVQHAQTFLYWDGDRTYEHPVSYYTNVKSWGTSPGFPASHANFNRFIGANCFECHSSFIKSELTASTKGIDEIMHKNTLVYGIDCERCHGPALNHVNFHSENPDETTAKYIVNIASLTRSQQLDVCAVCHSGNNKMAEKSTFKFRPGDTLSHFFTIWPYNDTSTTFDVHGNQYQLLSQSACFVKTNSLSCPTCHSPHADASNDLKIYSTICSGCHKDAQHSFIKDTLAKSQMLSNCIDCHMPSQPSNAITFFLEGNTKQSAYMLRAHKIGIYAKQR